MYVIDGWFSMKNDRILIQFFFYCIEQPTISDEQVPGHDLEIEKNLQSELELLFLHNLTLHALGIVYIIYST